MFFWENEKEQIIKKFLKEIKVSHESDPQKGTRIIKLFMYIFSNFFYVHMKSINIFILNWNIMYTHRYRYRQSYIYLHKYTIFQSTLLTVQYIMTFFLCNLEKSPTRMQACIYSHKTKSDNEILVTTGTSKTSTIKCSLWQHIY